MLKVCCQALGAQKFRVRSFKSSIFDQSREKPYLISLQFHTLIAATHISICYAPYSPYPFGRLLLAHMDMSLVPPPSRHHYSSIGAQSERRFYIRTQYISHLRTEHICELPICSYHISILLWHLLIIHTDGENEIISKTQISNNTIVKCDSCL